MKENSRIYLLDTNAFSDLMREHPALDARLAGISEENAVIICTIVRGEILYGLERLVPGRDGRNWKPKPPLSLPFSHVNLFQKRRANTMRRLNCAVRRKG